MDKTLSVKIKSLGFLCTVMVVFRHGYNLQAFGLNFYDTSYVTFVENGISKLTEVAVPYFFIVSGFFFFRSSYYGKGEFIHMLYKKFHSLFIPFIFWNIVGIIPLMLVNQFVYEDNPWKYILQLLNSDWNGVLWYVRDIMTLMALAPLYAWIFVLNNRLLYVAIFVILFTNWLPIDCGWISTEGTLFFFLGGVLQKNSGVLSMRINKAILIIIGMVWIISCFIFPFYWPIHRYNTLLGLVVVWYLFNFLSKQSLSRILSISNYSFFIYVVHAFIIKCMKIMVAHFFLGNEFVAFTSYIILPILTILITLYSGRMISKYMPIFYGVIVGGRR